MNYIGVNGMPTPLAEAVIPVMDHGFMYGIGLFETFRTYGGRPFLLERHLRRLHEGCRALGIGYEADQARIVAEIAELLELNGLAEGYIRYTVTAGEGPLGLPAGDYAEPTVIVYVKALPEPGASLYAYGKPLWKLATRRNTPEGDVRFKSLHYMNNLLAKRELGRLEREARESGAVMRQAPVPRNSAERADAQNAASSPHAHHPLTFAAPAEGLLLTAEGWLAEGIVSNLFFVQDGRLHTPDIGTGILPGITRALVLELAAEQGLAPEEGRYAWDRLLQADEIFLTNSIQEIVPVTALLEPGDSGKRETLMHTVADGQVGPITGWLLGEYREKARNGDATDPI
ncbi:aminotransferase class IV [Paenibacillus macerans]|uniref:aminotransferase class IV n=1 Tax=Paenibacillus macerans TaxID=44252 RepID=UPI003D30FF45